MLEHKFFTSAAELCDFVNKTNCEVVSITRIVTDRTTYTLFYRENDNLNLNNK